MCEQPHAKKKGNGIPRLCKTYISVEKHRREAGQWNVTSYHEQMSQYLRDLIKCASKFKVIETSMSTYAMHKSTVMLSLNAIA